MLREMFSQSYMAKINMQFFPSNPKMNRLSSAWSLICNAACVANPMKWFARLGINSSHREISSSPASGMDFWQCEAWMESENVSLRLSWKECVCPVVDLACLPADNKSSTYKTRLMSELSPRLQPGYNVIWQFSQKALRSSMGLPSICWEVSMATASKPGVLLFIWYLLLCVYPVTPFSSTHLSLHFHQFSFLSPFYTSQSVTHCICTPFLLHFNLNLSNFLCLNVTQLIYIFSLFCLRNNKELGILIS